MAQTNHITLASLLASQKTVKCEKCKQEISEKQLAENTFICPLCGKYNRIPARVRIDYLTDENSFSELFTEEVFTDPLSFPDYKEKYNASKAKSGENEGVICGTAAVNGNKTCLFVMDPRFMMGSMGTVVGDKIAALFEYAIARKLPVIGYTVSGGARMQEGILSLMQMAKVSAAVKKHSDAGLLYAICCTDPTMGGITASFAMLGDIIFAEPSAQIGFAGKRVVEQVTGEILPDYFQSAEFQLKNGFLDSIVERENQKEFISTVLSLHAAK